MDPKTMESEKVHVTVTTREMNEIADPFIDAMNNLQKTWPVDKVLAGMAAALGSAIRQRGALLALDAPLREALPPLVWGYESASKQMQDA